MLRKTEGDIDIMIKNKEYPLTSLDYSFLAQTELFENISQEGIRKLLQCSGAFVKDYEKGVYSSQ